MSQKSNWKCICGVATLMILLSSNGLAQEAAETAQTFAKIDGNEPGWKLLGEADFQNVNCKEDTWQWSENVLKCKGNCNGGLRTQQQYTNFEMVLEWKHLQDGGNSGVFIWSPKEILDKLAPNQLPQGIEIQVLDHGYAVQYEKSEGKKPDWFTTHGDVFPVGIADMKPFPPVAPDGKRSFPSANHSRGVGEWNHYYIRAINGEVRLWVNGYEVSGGSHCQPATGFVCLEAEGAPIDFRNIKIRVLP